MKKDVAKKDLTTLEKLDASLSFQLDQVMDSGLKGEELKEEIERSHEVNAISKQIINLYSLRLSASRFYFEQGVDPFYVERGKNNG